MRKNRVKISQSKPKKGTPEIPDSGKLTSTLTEEANLSLASIDVPAEPSFKLPVKSHGNEFLKISADEHLESEGIVSNEAGEINYSKSESVDNEPHQTSEFSEVETNPHDLIRQIQELQQEITAMTQRIVTTEEAMKIKDNEAHELKELLVKLRENQVMIMETAEKQPMCKSCVLF